MPDAGPPPLQALLAHRDFVRALAHALVFDPGEADDVAQLTWLAAIESPPARVTNARGWLGGVMRNLIRRARRAAARRVRRERAAARREGVEPAAELAAREDERRRVVDAVLALDEPFRTTVVLRYFEGLPPRAIARRLGVPPATVRTRLHRAHGELRERLDAAHGGDGRRWALALLPLALLAGRGRATPAAAAGLLAVAAVTALVALTLDRDGGRPEAPSGAPSGPATVAGPPHAPGPSPASSAPTADPADGPAPAPPGPAVTPIPGAILVVDDATGEPTLADVFTADAEHPGPLYELPRRLGTTEPDGVLVLAGRDLGTEWSPGRLFGAGRFLWALAQRAYVLERGIGGPVPLDLSAVMTEGLVIRLRAGCRIAGRVTDVETGAPVAGLMVHAFTRRNPGGFATTGADGRFTLRNLAHGHDYVCVAGGPGWRADIGGEWIEGNEWQPGAALDSYLPAHGVRFAALGDSREVALTVRRVADDTTALVHLSGIAPPWPSEGRVFVDGEMDVPVCSISAMDFVAGARRYDVNAHRGRTIRLTAEVPGYRTAQATVEIPDGPGEVEAALRFEPGGWPAIGRVVDAATGEPVAGAVVTTAPFWWRGGRPRGEITDRDGRFRVTASGMGKRLVAVAPGHGCSDWLAIGPDTTTVALLVVAGNEVTGVVRDRATGAPLPGVDVQLREPEGRNGLGPVATTDAQGRYRIAGVPPELPFVVNVQGSPRLRELGSGWTDVRGPRHELGGLGSHVEQDLTVDARPGAWLTVTLAWPDGTSAPRFCRVHEAIEIVEPSRRAASVSAGDGEWSWTLDADGQTARLSFARTAVEPVDPAAPRLRRFVPVGRTTIRVLTADLAGELRIDLQEARDALEATLRLERRPRVYAQLVDAAGQPVARAGVSVSVLRTSRRTDGKSSGSQGGGVAWTDATGRADLTTQLPPLVQPTPDARWDYGLDLRVGSHLSASVLTIGDGELLARLRATGGAVTLSLPAAPEPEPRPAPGPAEPVIAELHLRVLDAEDRPLGGATVHGRPAARFLDGARWVSGPDGLLRVRCRVGPGAPLADHPSLALEHPAWIGALDLGHWLAFWEPPEEEMAREGSAGNPMTLRAHAGRTIAVRLLDHRGRPLARREFHPQLTGVEDWPWLVARRTDAAGWLRLSVPSVTTEVYFNPPGRLAGSPDLAPVRFPLVAGVDEYTARFHARADVRLRVRDPDGHTPHLDWGHLEWQCTDAETGEPLPDPGGTDGHASPRLVDGVLRLSVAARPQRVQVRARDGGWEGEVRLRGEPGEKAVLALRPAADTHPVVFEFRDAGGAPVAGVRVRIQPIGFHDATIQGETDSAGRIQARLPAGRYDWIVIWVWDDAWALEKPGPLTDLDVPAPGPVVIRLVRGD